MDLDFDNINNYLHVVNSAIKARFKDINPKIEEVQNIVKALDTAINFGLSDDELEFLINKILEEQSVSLELSEDMLTDKTSGHVEWYDNVRVERGTKRYTAYEKYLLEENRFSNDVVNKIGEAANKIVSNIGDPLSEDNFDYKGLVIGDVQSGKTINFIALMNKAADAGYNFIVVATGTIEKLRRQTQERIEIGFGGIVTLSNNKNEIVTVKKYYDPKDKPDQQIITDKNSDFKIKGAPINELSNKIVQVAVIKKNKASLNNLKMWLMKYNKEHSIDRSLLFIDDEADNASINTKDADDPTVINKGIRDILNLFKRSSYIGFTATPFANVFIDPDVEKDLFPKNFIYVLKTPSDYMGASNIFDENGEYYKILYNNDDCGNFLPFRHKDEIIERMVDLPLSLKEAIQVFFIQNAIRDYLGHYEKHRSMLVNVSHRNAVQDKVKEMIFNFSEDLKRDIKNYLNKEGSIINTILEEIYNKHFGELDVDWIDIKEILLKSTDAIRIELINSKNKSFQYEDYPKGARVIAVGGFAVSRGLTLEGLSTSYIYRNSALYDTFMQMGRWFGYRPGYDKIVKLYLSEQSINWYKDINEATIHLKEQITEMINEKKTPSDFGLMIKESSKKGDEINLAITSRNKMKSASNHTVHVSISGTLKATPYVNINTISQNRDLTFKFIQKHFDLKDPNNNKNELIQDIPSLEVEKFLSKYIYGSSNDLNIDVIKEIINDFDKFTVYIAQGTKKLGNEINNIRMVRRAFYYNDKNNEIDFNFSGGNLLRTGQYNLKGLKEKDKIILDQYYEKHKISTKTNIYFDYNPEIVDVKRNPQLVIYPILLTKPSKDSKRFENFDIETQAKIKDFYEEFKEEIIFAISVGVPRIKDKKDIFYNTKINKIYEKQLREKDSGQYYIGFDDEYEDDID